MFLPILLVFRLLIPLQGSQPYDSQRYRAWETAQTVPYRLLELMKIIYFEAVQKVTELNPQRFMYENTPFYEQGYVYGEINERYKRMVLQRKRMDRGFNVLYDLIDKAEQIQKLNFQIFHLVKMMHEIPLKYRHVKGFELDPVVTEEEHDLKDLEEYEQLSHEYEAIESWKKVAIANRQRLLKHRQALLSEGKLKERQVHPPPGGKKKKYNTQWERDYGWEIYDWD